MLTQSLRYANFGPRLLANLLDFLLLIPLWGAAAYYTSAAPDFTIYLLIVIPMALYKPVLEGLYGATLGKKILKLKVVGEDGEKAGWGPVLMRWTPWLIGTAVGIYYVNVLFQIPGYTDIEGFTDNGLFMVDAMKEGYWSNSNSTIQTVAGFLPLFSALVIVFTAKRQAAHDILAQTLVIHTEPKIPLG